MNTPPTAGRCARGWRWGIVCLLAMVRCAWAAEGISVEAEIKPVERAVQRLAVKKPVSVQRGLTAPAAEIRLPALDLEPVLLEDELADDAGRPVRIGVFREVAAAPVKTRAKPSLWTALPDGSHLWRLAVESPEAIGIRVHFANLALPAGAEITAHATLDPAQVRGPYTAADLADRTEFWTGTVFAEHVTVECFLPAGIPVTAAQLEVDRIIHIYRDPVMRIKVGSCHNTLACHSAWVPVGNGVAGMGTIGETGYVWCTGCLLNDQDPGTFIDYFMTANHCVANQSEASDTEFYWFYQAASCSSTPPRLSTVPRTEGGATYLAGRSFSAGNDFAFLRLRRASPGGTTYLGWTTATPTTSETLAGIHHPDGSFKRISFGKLASSDSKYWIVRWSSGVTEPGSSGSPLLNANRQFIGQLYGGSSSCSNPRGTDEYGRFNVSYPYIKQWLGPQTLTISPTGRVHSSAAATGQAFAVASGGVAWTAGANQTWISLTGPTSGTGNGTVTYRIAANAGTTRTGTITVAGGGITRGFRVTQHDGDIYEPDNVSSAAKEIKNTQVQQRSIHRPGDVDWVKFTVGGIGARNLLLEMSGDTGPALMWLIRGSTGQQLAFDDGAASQGLPRIRVAELGSGTHLVRIKAYSDTMFIPAYTLRASWLTLYAPDAYENDNLSSRARAIANGQTQRRSIHVAGDTDWARFRIGSRGARNVTITTAGPSGDTKLWLIRGSTRRTVAFDDNSGSGKFSRIRRASLPGGTYFIKVQQAGNNRVIPAYTLRATWTNN